MKAESIGQTIELGNIVVDGEALAQVCRCYGIRELSLFGSAARGEMGPDSDIDIMVEFPPDTRIGMIKFELLAEELTRLAGRKVDLVSKRGLKPSWTEAMGALRSSQRPSVHLCGMKLDSDKIRAMALVDEVRMDRSVISVVTTETPSDAKEYWKTRTMEERLAALELTRQIMNAYDPDTTRFQRILEVARCP